MEKRYISVGADKKVWLKLSPRLRGKEFRVPRGWREGAYLDYRDWKLLVRYGVVGKTVYVQKNKRIDYREIVAGGKFSLDSAEQ
ncbi:MAG: hypothetical protein HY769_00800 [Candidatus Stahlbacteria bacterium]|nr:hypothetical protein [Candidatus Stahlbacteria bacterium]